MTRKSSFLSDELQEYLTRHGTPPDPVLADLAEETARLFLADMQIAPEQGTLLTQLTSFGRVRAAIEIGTFTGYSSICIARGLVPGGRLICCDVSEKWTAMARRYWERAGVADRIELRLGPAAETLRALPEEPTFDLAFIDADKVGYLDYYRLLVPRLRPGGLLLADNVLWSAKVVSAAEEGRDTEALRRFNDEVAADQRVDVVMLPLADGLTLARKLS